MASFFAGPFVGFAGARGLPSWYAPSVAEVVEDVLVSGRGVAVGCAGGADELVRSAWCASFAARQVPPVLVFARRLFPASTLAGSLAARSVALVRFVAASGPGAAFVGFPAVPCPAGLVPNARPGRCFAGFGAGTWAALALAAGLGVPVSLRCCQEAVLPAWPGGVWEASAYGSLWVPAALVVQGSLWD